MTHDTEKIIAALRSLCPSTTFDESAAQGWHALLVAGPAQLPAVAEALLGHGFFLVFITAVHVSPGCELVYQFARYESPMRVHVRAAAQPGQAVPSIAAVYQGAAWHEREIHDFFGIEFSNHPGLKPLILTRGEKGLNPLLKQDAALKQRGEIFTE